LKFRAHNFFSSSFVIVFAKYSALSLFFPSSFLQACKNDEKTVSKGCLDVEDERSQKQQQKQNEFLFSF